MHRRYNFLIFLQSPILLFVAVEIMDFDIKNNISISANDDLRTQQMEIVELVEKRR